MAIIDAYAHVSLPRFLSVEDLLRLMDREGVEAALLSTAETCPDVRELSRALSPIPDRFRAVGMPLGAIAARICAMRSARSSTAASPASACRRRFIAANPDVLDLHRRGGRVPLVVGEQGLRAAAGLSPISWTAPRTSRVGRPFRRSGRSFAARHRCGGRPPVRPCRLSRRFHPAWRARPSAGRAMGGGGRAARRLARG